MFLKHYKPTSAGSRNKYLLPYKNLHLFKFKPLLHYCHTNGGRNSSGRITIRHRGKLSRHSVPQIDYLQNKFSVPYQLVGYSFSKKTTNIVGLIRYLNGAYSYVLTADNTTVGSLCDFKDYFFGKSSLGLRLPISLLKLRLSICFNVELRPGSGGKFARAGGTYARILPSNFVNKSLVELPSKKKIIISNDCLVTIGRSSNIFNRLQTFSKAGSSRYRGIRPTVRGEAMNAVDHPHGGRTKGGVPRRTPWGRNIK